MLTGATYVDVEWDPIVLDQGSVDGYKVSIDHILNSHYLFSSQGAYKRIGAGSASGCGCSCCMW